VTADPTVNTTNPKETTVTNPAPNTTVEPSQTAETDPATAAGADATTDQGEAGEGADAAALRAEAAKHRTKARAAEAERDALAGTVATYQRRDAEALVGTRLLSPADLWVGDATKLADLLAEDGTVDKAKVDAAVAAVLAEHPHWAPKRPGVPRDMGQGRRESSSGGTSWSSVLTGGRRN
jgi:hypothetical protein